MRARIMWAGEGWYASQVCGGGWPLWEDVSVSYRLNAESREEADEEARVNGLGTPMFVDKEGLSQFDEIVG